MRPWPGTNPRNQSGGVLDLQGAMGNDGWHNDNGDGSSDGPWCVGIPRLEIFEMTDEVLRLEVGPSFSHRCSCFSRKYALAVVIEGMFAMGHYTVVGRLSVSVGLLWAAGQELVEKACSSCRSDALSITHRWRQSSDRVHLREREDPTSVKSVR